MCPSDNELVALAQGELPPAEAERVGAHARGCAACRSLLSKLSGPDEAPVAGEDDSGEAPPPRATPDFVPDRRKATEDRRKGAETLPVLPDDGLDYGEDTETLERGAVVGRYDILQHLASGGMGAVYAAYDPQLDRRVALKVLAHRGRSEVSRERLHLRLQREAQAMARLTHPNVVAVHDVGTFQGRVFLAMEFVDGVNLREWLREKKRTWQEVRDLFVQAGRGLSAAHAVGLIHRDFKPDNVLIGKDGRARVADFGLARPAHESRHDDLEERTGSTELPLLDTPLTQAGTIMGTPRYMAPEQIRAEPTDERTDQFSVAVALYDALYGVRPFEPKVMADRLAAIERGQIVAPPPGHGVPEWLGQAVRRALSADPSKRWPSMDAFLEALQQDARRGRSNARVAAIALAGVLAVSAMAAGGAYALRPDLRCKVPESALAGTWDAERRAAMRRAFAAHPDGEAQFDRTAGVLDDYARQWTAMREETCAATRVRGDQPESVMELRMGCLDLRRHELQYLTALFASADAKLVERGVDAASGLSSVRSCGDTTALTEAPLPEDPAARDTIRALKEQLSEVNALRDAGRYKDALEKATAIVERARNLHYKPVEAEALMLQGILFDKTGEYARALDNLRAAALAADAGRADMVRVRAATEAVYAATSTQDFARAKEWAAQAQSVLDRVGGHAESQGNLLVNEGTLHLWEGQHTLAATMLEQARQLLAVELGRDDPRTLTAAGNLAVAYEKLGRLDDAITLLEETTASVRRRLGPDHPMLVPRLYATAHAKLRRHDFGSAHKTIDEALRIARARMGEENAQVANLLLEKASIFQAEHRFQDALATYQRAQEIHRKVLPPDSQLLSYSYDGIGQSLLGLGRPEEARPSLEKALAIRGSDPEDLADTHYALARTLWQLGQQKAAALHHGEEALRDYQRAQRQDMAAEVEGWLAKRR